MDNQLYLTKIYDGPTQAETDRARVKQVSSTIEVQQEPSKVHIDNLA